MEAEEQVYDASPILDAVDIDLLVKVLAHTAFSTWLYTRFAALLMIAAPVGPFFTFFIPVFYFFQGSRWPNSDLVLSAVYCVAVSAFCVLFILEMRRCLSLTYIRVLQVVFPLMAQSGQPTIRASPV